MKKVKIMCLGTLLAVGILCHAYSKENVSPGKSATNTTKSTTTTDPPPQPNPDPNPPPK